MSDRPVAVRARDLTRTFGAFVAVDHLNFEIPSGAVWGFLGPNGAGKSTTIRMLCGILSPTAGGADVLGYDVARNPEAIKARIGYMSQRFSLYDDLTVDENLAFFAGVYGLSRPEARDRSAEWIAEPICGAASVRWPGRCRADGSSAWRWGAPCCTARAWSFSMSPPAASTRSAEKWDLIGQFAEDGVTVMVTTHYMDEAEHCDTLAFIFGGRIIAMGTPDEIERREMSGALFEIMTAQYGMALDALSHVPEVHEAALFGRAVHVTVQDPDTTIPAIRKALADRGVLVDTVRPVAPSLEDAFVFLVERPGAGTPQAPAEGRP